MKIAGIVFFILSIILGISAIAMKTSISTSEGAINTLGLLQGQMLLMGVAGVLFLAGCILIGFGFVSDLLKENLYNPIPLLVSINDKIPELKETDLPELEESETKGSKDSDDWLDTV
jgi:hypothetical protein